MYKNYFTITLRVFHREKVYSLINIAGLALGFTCTLMIYLFISDELSYDTIHHDNDRIYRVAAAYMRQNKWEPYASNSWKTGELIKTNYSDIEQLVRIRDDNDMFVYGDKRVMEYHCAWVDDNFFSVFNFPLVMGNPAEALKGTYKAVISESTAARYFGTDNPMGKVFDVRDGAFQLQVSGVMKDMPRNSHFHFDILVSGETLRQTAPEQLFTNVGWDSQYIYIKLAPGADIARMEATFPEFVDKNLSPFNAENFKLFTQPLSSIHLESNIGLELEDNGSMYRIYAFSVIAVFILVIACVNYMNLTTARSLRRAKEVGMRKVLGARKGELVKQFLTESVVTTTISLLLAVLVTTLLLPTFNQFAGKAIASHALFTPYRMAGMVAALLVISVVSGFYPSLIVSSFKPLNNIKNSATPGVKSGFVLRRALVVLQFAISIGLIAGSAIVFQQWQYLANKSLGINKESVIAVPLQTLDTRKIDPFRDQLLTNPSVKKVAFSNMQMPGWISNSTSYRAQDVEVDEEVNKSMKIIRIDYDFFSTLEADIAKGRDLSRAFPADSISSIIINESAVAQLGWKDPIGRWMELNGNRFTVVGVVKDFHFESLHRQIPPTIFMISPNTLHWAYIKIAEQNIPASIKQIEKTYSHFVSNRDFSFTFLDQDIARQYEGEQKFTQVFTIFTILAIIIACLGTFGLISFNAERRAKEIGIRKVLGASIRSVSFMLIREFVILLVIASIIAWPITWYFLKGWVDDFVYRTDIGAWPFVIATSLAAGIVILTTGVSALKAAVANPVDSLMRE